MRYLSLSEAEQFFLCSLNTRRMGSSQIETLRCKIFPSYTSDETVTMLYEDDGVTREYETGAYAKTYMSCKNTDGVMTVKVGAAEGIFAGQPQSRSITVELPGLSEKATIKAPRKSRIEHKDGVTYVYIPQQSVRQEQIIKITNPYR